MSQQQGVDDPTRAGAWRDEELANPHAHADKAGKVRGMFASIAGSYDLNNRVHSLWQDQRWRRRAVRMAELKPRDEVLDVACGTGDLSRAFAAAGAAKVVGLDFTREMLEVARRKPGRAGEVDVAYIEGDAQALPFPEGSFDVVSIAFGIRNVANPAKAAGEFARVLRPGGRVVVLEFDRPRSAVAAWLNDLYCKGVMPRTATWISGDKTGAYKYLPSSVATFQSRQDMVAMLEKAGFEAVRTHAMTLGICVCYAGRKK